ncbi:MAG TPA: DNA-formamidopyrimidine glycosylase family protein [Vicinamibacterales bacterium]|nr:DNA-formamidopyrimidine glycosylase family protein [Vicinamibacterales bacterium]
MPEGDTIYRAARTLNRALAGDVVVRFESVLPALTRVDEDRRLAGRTVEEVTAAGKHLLMRFSGDLVLRTHMRMNGSWHIYRPGERWRRPRRDMRVVVATARFEAVGFNIPVAEFLTPDGIRRQEDLRNMGPDLLAERFDAEHALARVRERGASTIADALINQRVVAGAGNVYKSEVLFLCRIDPATTVDLLTDDQIRGILTMARTLLRANVDKPRGGIVTYTGYRRTTRRANPAERLYVYGRAGKPCRSCGTPIRVRAEGPNARLTYWCPACQSSGSR